MRIRLAVRKWIAALLAAGIALSGSPLCFARADGPDSPTASPVLIELAPTPTAEPEATLSPIPEAETAVATETPAAPAPSETPAPTVTLAPEPTATPTPTVAPTQEPTPSSTPSLISESVAIEGPTRVAKGRSATYTAAVLPETALDRSVTWSIVRVETESGAVVPPLAETPVPAASPKPAETPVPAQPALETPAPDDSDLPAPSASPSPSPSPTPSPAPVSFDRYGVSLSEDGTLTVDAYADAAKVTIAAKAADGGAFAEATVLLPERAARGVKLRSNDMKALSSGRMRDSVVLFTQNVPAGDYDTADAPNDETSLQLYAYAEDGETLLLTPEWSVDDESVVTVSKTGLVRAVGVGKTCVVCRAGDGGTAAGKLFVQVAEPAARISVSIEDAPLFEGEALLTFGSSVRISAAAYTAEGAVTDTAISFDYAVFSFDADGGYVDDMTAQFNKKRLVSVSDFGTLRVSYDLSQVWERDTVSYTMWLTARAKDGGGAVATLPIRILPKTTFLTAEGSRHVTLSAGETVELRFISDSPLCNYKAQMEDRAVAALVGGFHVDDYPYTACTLKALSPGETKLGIHPGDGASAALTYVITVLE